MNIASIPTIHPGPNGEMPDWPRNPSAEPASGVLRGVREALSGIATDGVSAFWSDNITMMYDTREQAWHGQALLKSEIDGVPVSHYSLPIGPDHAYSVTAGGLADLLRGVAGLDVDVADTPGVGVVIGLSTTNEPMRRQLQKVLDSNPAPGIELRIHS